MTPNLYKDNMDRIYKTGEGDRPPVMWWIEVDDQYRTPKMTHTIQRIFNNYGEEITEKGAIKSFLDENLSVETNNIGVYLYEQDLYLTDKSRSGQAQFSGTQTANLSFYSKHFTRWIQPYEHVICPLTYSIEIWFDDDTEEYVVEEYLGAGTCDVFLKYVDATHYAFQDDDVEIEALIGLLEVGATVRLFTNSSTGKQIYTFTDFRGSYFATCMTTGTGGGISVTMLQWDSTNKNFIVTSKAV